MLLKNRFLQITILIVVLQQILLAISTYLIAIAGASLGSGKAKETLFYIIWFFITALLSYISSSFNNFLIVKLKNSLWKNGIRRII